jgi:clan AA aspartic protease (TIGR02281 family)
MKEHHVNRFLIWMTAALFTVASLPASAVKVRKWIATDGTVTYSDGILHNEPSGEITYIKIKPSPQVRLKKIRLPGDLPASEDIVIPRDADGFFTVDGQINGFGVNFLVDTGSSWVAFNRPIARRLGIDFSPSDFDTSVETAHGRVSVMPVRLRHVEIGGIRLENVQGGVIDTDSGHEVLLGMSFLSELDITIENQSLELRRRGSR